MFVASLIAALPLAESGAPAKEESGSFLVSPDVGLMIWTLIVFGVSLYILKKAVRGVITKSSRTVKIVAAPVSMSHS